MLSHPSWVITASGFEKELTSVFNKGGFFSEVLAEFFASKGVEVTVSYIGYDEYPKPKIQHQAKKHQAPVTVERTI